MTTNGPQKAHIFLSAIESLERLRQEILSESLVEPKHIEWAVRIHQFSADLMDAVEGKPSTKPRTVTAADRGTLTKMIAFFADLDRSPTGIERDATVDMWLGEGPIALSPADASRVLVMLDHVLRTLETDLGEFRASLPPHVKFMRKLFVSAFIARLRAADKGLTSADALWALIEAHDPASEKP